MQLYNLERNFLMWSIVTSLSAYPSFMLALTSKALIAPMIIGILLVIVSYTIASSGEFWQNIRLNKKYFTKALKYAFIIRISASAIGILIELSYGANPQFIVVDGYLGLVTLAITQIVFSENVDFARNIWLQSNFMEVLFATLTQALLMSLLILFIAFIIWIFIRVFNILKKINSKTSQ